MGPVVLTILDGWGYSREKTGNAIASAKTPILDNLKKEYPFLLLQASGPAVGIDWGEAGNSEVGHLVLGSGRITTQYSKIINDSIKSGDFFNNETFQEALSHVKKFNSSLHLIGLLTSGSVHANLNHLMALLDISKKNNIQNVRLHLFTDGKDSGLKEALKLIEKIDSYLNKLSLGEITSMVGRNFAMDRNNNWDLTQKAYNLMAFGQGNQELDVIEALKKYYDQGLRDPQIPPTTFNPSNVVNDNDAIIFFNFREDSMRQLVEPFLNKNFNIFEIKRLNNVFMVGMIQYFDSPDLHAAFETIKIPLSLSEILDKNQKKHLHIAESEKYAHVTYFFNGLKYDPFKYETDFIVESFKDSESRPEMRSKDIVQKVKDELKRDYYDFFLINFANADVLAHSGNFNATVAGLEIVDSLLGALKVAVLEKNGIMIITADHGNAETLTYTGSGEIETKHSSNSVPFYLIGQVFEKYKKEEPPAEQPKGLLADVAPTILDLMGLEIPSEMTGQSLLGQIKILAHDSSS